MTAATLTLTDFLLARVKEEEEMWTMARDAGLVIAANGMSAIPPQAWTERRVAECEAHRQIVEMEPDCAFDRFQRVAWDDCHETTLRALALPYVDHPDYDEAWRP